MLVMSQYTLPLFEAPQRPDKEQIAALLEVRGQELRAAFIARYGYRPEDSATPYVPVTIDGPQDHDSYYAKEYP
jgi:hypothetical protein